MLNKHIVYFDSVFSKNAIIQNVIFQLFFLFQKDAIKIKPSCCLLDVANKSSKQHFVLPNFEESFYMYFIQSNF